MFSKWVEVFPWCKADTLTETKKLLEKMFPTWGIVSKCSLKATSMAPPCSMGQWHSTCHCFSSQHLWNSMYWWHTMWRFASTAENCAGLAEPSTTEKMGSESTQNSRTRHHSKAFGSYGCIRQRQRQAYSITKNVKRVQAFVGIWWTFILILQIIMPS